MKERDITKKRPKSQAKLKYCYVLLQCPHQLSRFFFSVFSHLYRDISHSPREKTFFSRHMIPAVEPLQKLAEVRGEPGNHNYSIPARLGRIRRPPPPPPIVRRRRPSCSRSITTPSTIPPLGAAPTPPPTANTILRYSDTTPPSFLLFPSPLASAGSDSLPLRRPSSGVDALRAVAPF